MIVLARARPRLRPDPQPPRRRVGVRSRPRFVVVLVAVAVAALAADRCSGCSPGTPGCAPATSRSGSTARAHRWSGSRSTSARRGSRPPCSPAPRWRCPASLVQATCRNPLAEPGILGITGGAGVGAVIVVTGSVTAAPSNSAVLGRRRGRRAGRVRPRLRAGLARRARRRPAGADRHRHLVRLDRADDVPAGPRQPVGHAAHLHLAVRARPTGAPATQVRAGRRRAGRRAAAASGSSGASSTCSPSTTTPRAWSASASSGCGWSCWWSRPLLAATSVAAVGVVGFVGLVAPHVGAGPGRRPARPRRCRSPCCSARSCSAPPTPSAGR